MMCTGLQELQEKKNMHPQHTLEPFEGILQGSCSADVPHLVGHSHANHIRGKAHHITELDLQEDCAGMDGSSRKLTMHAHICTL